MVKIEAILKSQRTPINGSRSLTPLGDSKECLLFLRCGGDERSHHCAHPHTPRIHSVHLTSTDPVERDSAIVGNLVVNGYNGQTSICAVSDLHNTSF